MQKRNVFWETRIKIKGNQGGQKDVKETQNGIMQKL